MPLTCCMPIFSMNSMGITREAKARRNMVLNSLSSPPMPISVKFQSGLMILRYEGTPSITRANTVSSARYTQITALRSALGSVCPKDESTERRFVAVRIGGSG